jgi:hypothetical protein
MSYKTEFGQIESKGDMLYVKVSKPNKYIVFKGPDAFLKTATFTNENHLLDVVQDGTTIIIDAPPYDSDKVDWEIVLEFDPSEKPVGKSISEESPDIILPAGQAKMHGEKVMYETAQIRDYIGYWVNPDDYVSWGFNAEKAGEYLVEMTVGCDPGQEGSTYAIEAGDDKLAGIVHKTGNWRTFTIEQIGKLHLGKGDQTLIVRPVKMAKNAVMNIKRVSLFERR